MHFFKNRTEIFNFFENKVRHKISNILSMVDELNISKAPKILELSPIVPQKSTYHMEFRLVFFTENQCSY